MAQFLSPFEDFGFLPKEKGLEPEPKKVDSVVTDKIIFDLRKRLNSTKRSQRLSAAWEISKLKDERLLPILKKALMSEEDKGVLSELISAFVHYPEKDAVAELSRFVFQAKDKELRKKVIWVFSHFVSSKESFSALRNLALTDPEPTVRKEAVFALGEIANPQAIEVLREVLLTDEKANVRKLAVWSLGQFNDSGAEWLNKALHEDVSSEVRREAAWILGKKRIVSSLSDLKEALKRESILKVLEVIIWSIAQIAPKELRNIIFILEEDYSSKLKAEYIWLLGRFSQAQVLKKVAKNYWGSPSNVKRALIWALSQAKANFAPRYLRQWYKKEKKKSLKEKIMWAMGKGGN